MESTILSKLQQFINIAEDHYTANEWIDDDTMRVYVRRARRYIGKKIRYMLDIGSVEVVEAKRGQGIFSNFLEKAIEMNPWDGIYVECVHNSKLAVSLLKRGFICIDTTSQNYYLPKDFSTLYG